MSKRRVGSHARLVGGIVGDVTAIEDVGRFDVWHDRAVFHFLTQDEDRRHYVRLRIGSSCFDSTEVRISPRATRSLHLRPASPRPAMAGRQTNGCRRQPSAS